MSVAAYQRAFAAALDGGGVRASGAGHFGRAGSDREYFGGAETYSPWSGVLAQPAFAVHRNNAMVACVDALAANFPTVVRLVGEAFFRDMAVEFARSNLPTRPSLFDYGAEFADFIASYAPAAAVPYLADVARVDRWWLESHVAADADVLTGAALAELDPAVLDDARLRIHPAVRCGWFAQPIHTIWYRNRVATEATADELEWREEGVMVTRPFDDVTTCAIGRAAVTFLTACSGGATLAEAIARAFESEPEADLAAVFAQLVGAGAFTALEDR